MASGADVERCFSLMGFFDTGLRNRLSPATTQMLTAVKMAYVADPIRRNNPNM